MQGRSKRPSPQHRAPIEPLLTSWLPPLLGAGAWAGSFKTVLTLDPNQGLRRLTPHNGYVPEECRSTKWEVSHEGRVSHSSPGALFSAEFARNCGSGSASGLMVRRQR